MSKMYHRYLNLPFEIAKPPIDFTVKPEWENINLNGKYMDQNVKSFFEDLGLECGQVEVVYTPPNSEIPIHGDDYNFKTKKCDSHVKLNITWGPEEGSVRFWKSKKTHVMIYRVEGKKILTLAAEKEDSTMVYEANTNSPSLINVGELHSTYNPKDEPRWTLCFVPTIKGKIIKPYDALRIFDEFIT